MKKHRHRKYLQILVIPDDQEEPRTFRVSLRRLKVYKILGIILIVHLVIGLVAYEEVVRLFSRNRELTGLNRQLMDNSQKIYELVSAFKEMETNDAKIREALGLSEQNRQSFTIESHDQTPQVVRDYLPVYDRQSTSLASEPVNLREKLDFLQRSSTSGIHDYLRSIPTFLPVEGVLTNDYEEEFPAIGRSRHRGIDIAAPRGSFVRAAGDGIAIFTGWTQGLGNLIIIFHGNGYFTYYGHNQRLLVQRNSIVRKGDPIALVGSSGESSAPHLHFEILKDGVPLDPKDYILAFSGK